MAQTLGELIQQSEQRNPGSGMEPLEHEGTRYSDMLRKIRRERDAAQLRRQNNGRQSTASNQPQSPDSQAYDIENQTGADEFVNIEDNFEVPDQPV